MCSVVGVHAVLMMTMKNAESGGCSVLLALSLSGLISRLI